MASFEGRCGTHPGSDRKVACPLDRVNRQFRADRPNKLWVSEFTNVAAWQGWLYVAFVIDVIARRILGWRVSSSMRADLRSWTRWSKRCTSGCLNAMGH